MSDELIIYWTPQAFVTSKESWNLLYQKPRNVYSELIDMSSTKSPIRLCPATKDNLTKTFSIYSALEESIDFSDIDLEELDKNTPIQTNFNIRSVIALQKDRESSFPGYLNFSYNLSWLFFAEEPVIARFTAPYFPTSSPAQGAYLAPGQFDIGQWFRPFNLDYHIPYSTKSFNINTTDPLFFVEIFTNKKVVFKRFVKNAVIDNIATEMSSAPAIYTPFKKLSQRYDMFNKSQIREILLKEIKKEIIE